MTEYDILLAAAGKLVALWPDRPVYTQAIPVGAEGSFFLAITGAEAQWGLDRQRVRQLKLQVRYLMDQATAEDWCEWEESMLSSFRYLDVPEGEGTCPVRLSAHKGQVAGDGKSCEITFTARLHYRAEAEEEETMEALEQEATMGTLEQEERG